MTKNTRTLLKHLDEFFATADTESTREVWDVLTALRGPDNEDSRLKYDTTARIRSKAFPRLAMRNEFEDVARAIFSTNLDRPEKPKGIPYSTHPHFLSHVSMAARVLWGEKEATNDHVV